MTYWNQFQANAASQGFAPLFNMPVSSAKWQVEVGPVAFASPVIGQDRTIYIGNLMGELVAVLPTGTIRWKKMLDQRGSIIAGTPAVDKNGNIYVITTFRARVRDHRGGRTVYSYVAHSKLHSLTPDGQLRWIFNFPLNPNRNITDGYTLSSPKIWNTQEPLIFIPVLFTKVVSRMELLAIDQAGRVVNNVFVSEYPTPPIETSGGVTIGGIFGGIWDFLNGMEFEPSGGSPTLQQMFGWAEPSIAIADFGSFSSRPVIIVDDNYKQLSAFRWQNNQFRPLWNKTSSKPRLRASPAIFLSSMVASGQQDGTLAFYDLLTGSELLKPWFKARKGIQSPPASFISQIYFVAGTWVVALDAGGRLIREFEMSEHSLGAAIGSPAISGNRVYVNAQEGLFSFSLNLDDFDKNTLVLGGVSSPAIGDDGTVYVVDRNKQLWALGE